MDYCKLFSKDSYMSKCFEHIPQHVMQRSIFYLACTCGRTVCLSVTFHLRSDFESWWVASLVTHCFLLFLNKPASCPVKVEQTTPRLLFGICHRQFICALVWKNYVLALPTWLLDEGGHESRPLQGLSKPAIILKEKSNSSFCHARH